MADRALLDVSGIRIPDSHAAVEAEQRCREESSPVLYAHALCSYFSPASWSVRPAASPTARQRCSSGSGSGGASSKRTCRMTAETRSARRNILETKEARSVRPAEPGSCSSNEILAVA